MSSKIIVKGYILDSTVLNLIRHSVSVLDIVRSHFWRAEVEALQVNSIYWPAWAINAVIYAEQKKNKQNIWTFKSL